MREICGIMTNVQRATSTLNYNAEHSKHIFPCNVESYFLKILELYEYSNNNSQILNKVIFNTIAAQ